MTGLNNDYHYDGHKRDAKGENSKIFWSERIQDVLQNTYKKFVMCHHVSRYAVHAESERLLCCQPHQPDRCCHAQREHLLLFGSIFCFLGEFVFFFYLMCRPCEHVRCDVSSFIGHF